MKNKIFTLLFVCLSLWISPAIASEVIHTFDSLIQVQTDGSMIVTETLRVRHEGDKIRRGIYRDLPTNQGEKYELISIRRNGFHEPGFVEKRRGYYRINTGDDYLLPHPAISTFEIKYKVWNIPEAYDDYDEIYWNVTGDKWAFPIESVSAKVELPHGADIIQQAGYVGYKGSQKSATYEGTGQFSGGYLSPGEQLSIAVGFTPDIVSTEKQISETSFTLYAISLMLYVVYLGFLIWVWDKKGRDPAARAVMPQYEAPEKELTAAQAACLYHKRESLNLVPISLIQMITNGFLKLTVNKEETQISSHPVYILEKTGKAPSNFEEECFSMDQIKLNGEYQSCIERLASRMQSRIKKAMKPFYTRNQIWVLYPTFLLLFSLLWMWGWQIFSERDLVLLCAIFIMLSIFGEFLAKTLLRQIMRTLPYAFFMFSFFYTEEYCDIHKSALLLCILFTYSIFLFLIYQPTEKGQRLTEYLEGLKMFLKATRLPVKDNLNLEEKLNQKAMKKLFPYAMALGLEKEWIQKFKKLFGMTAYDHFVQAHPYASVHFIRSFSSYTSSGGSRGGGHAGGGRGGGGGGGR